MERFWQISTNMSSSPPPPFAPPTASPKLLDQVRAAIRLRHYSRRTEQVYVAWIRRFIVFHGKRHPRELGKREVTAFVSSLAARKVSASTQNQALSAVLFLFEVVLARRLSWMDEIVRAKRPVRLPVVLSRHEVSALLSRLRGPVWLMASLLYGAGLRLAECVELRVKDLNFDRGELTIRDVRRDRQQAKFWLAPVSLAWNHGFSARELNDIRRLILEHEQEIIEAWNEHCSQR